MAKKRPNGDGSGYYDPTRKRWHFAGTIDGQRRKVSATTRREALERFETLRSDDGRPKPGANETAEATVAELLERWYIVVASGLRYSTRVGYRNVIDAHLTPFLGARPISSLSTHDVETLQVQLLRTLSVSSVRHVRTVLKQAYDLAAQHRLVTANPVLSVRAPRKPDSTADSLSLADARKILAASLHPREKARWLLAISMGLRQGEALALRWADLELDEHPRRLTIAGTLQRQRGVGLVIAPTKTRKSRRTLQLADPIVDALHEWRDTQQRYSAPKRPSEFVFTTDNGQLIDPANDRKHWIKILAEVGVPYVRLHSCRHTAATLMLTQGSGLEVVREVLGHSTIRTTADIYGHLTGDIGGPAIEKLANALTQ